MSKNPNSLPILLRHLAKAAERLTDKEIEDVVAGRRRLIVTTEAAVSSRTAGAEEDQVNFDSLIANLKAAATRDAAQRLIDDASLTRNHLAQLAKTLDLPVQRSDDVARIREKIVETTIGFRLTSNAIHRNP